MPLINVTEDEWNDADNFFNNNPTEIKYRKIQTLNGQMFGRGQAHSFIRFNNVNYVVNNTQYMPNDIELKPNTKYVPIEPDAGSGGMSRVKIALNRQGERFAVKIDARPPEQLRGHLSTQLLRELGHILSDRIARKVKPEEGESGILKLEGGHSKTTAVKFYTLLPYLGDRELFSELIDIPRLKKKRLTESENLVLILKAMMSIQALHQKGIIHGDVKPENFMVNGQSETLTIAAIDFDFSRQLRPGKEYAYSKRVKGTPQYRAPEVTHSGRYYLASDVYAFGKILTCLRVKKIDTESLINENHAERPTLMQAMSNIALALQVHNLSLNKSDILITKTLDEFEQIRTNHHTQSFLQSPLPTSLPVSLQEPSPIYCPSTSQEQLSYQNTDPLQNLAKLTLEEKQSSTQDNRPFKFKFR